MISVYFRHDTLTPQNVRLTWKVASGADAPVVGDRVTAQFGALGARVTWVVVKREWTSETSLELTMAGPAQ